MDGRRHEEIWAYVSRHDLPLGSGDRGSTKSQGKSGRRIQIGPARTSAGCHQVPEETAQLSVMGGGAFLLREEKLREQMTCPR